jgi:hypothetical protein
VTGPGSDPSPQAPPWQAAGLQDFTSSESRVTSKQFLHLSASQRFTSLWLASKPMADYIIRADQCNPPAVP